MKALTKVAVVLGGYGAALTGGVAALAFYDTLLPPGTSDGMAAFGGANFAFVACGAMCLVPTALGLWWLRPVRGFWQALKAVCLAAAATGPAALALVLATRRLEPQRNLLFLASFFGLERLFASPVFCGGFLTAGLLTPAAYGRRLVFVAAAVEAAVSVLAWWFFLSPPGFWHRTP